MTKELTRIEDLKINQVYSACKYLLLLLIFLFCLVWNSPLFAQDINKDQLLAKIKLTESLLKSNVETRDKSIVQLTVLGNQIKLREQLIYTLGKEIARLETETYELNGRIENMESILLQLKNNYARMAQKTYQSFNDDSFWLTVLSSRSLSEAYYRCLYFVQFSRFRKRQVEQINLLKIQLEEKKKALRESLASKNKLRLQKGDEIELMIAKRHEQEGLISHLRSEEKVYRSRLREEKGMLKRFIEQIDEKFGEESEFYRNETVESAFVRQKGFHYWPVSYNKGVIIGKYGKSEDIFGNSIFNDGIYIETPEKQEVRSIFQGSVTGVREVPNQGYMVIIEHGNFRVVYANLIEISVKSGSLVGANETIGKVRNNPRTGESILQFYIYRLPGEFVNPEDWIFTD